MSLITASERVKQLLGWIRSDFEALLSLSADMTRMKEQWTAAQFCVGELQPAKECIHWMKDGLQAISTANKALKSFRDTAKQVMGKLGLQTGAVNTRIPIISASYGNVQPDNNKKGIEHMWMRDTIQMKLKESCLDYDAARELLRSDIETCTQIVDGILALDTSADEDEVSFTARGELVKASRSSLLETKDTYFYGLLNRDAWKTDKLGAYSINEDASTLRIILAGVVDKALFETLLLKLTFDQRANLEEKLEYYQVPASVVTRIRAGACYSVKYSKESDKKVTIRKTTDEYTNGSVIWDVTIREYTAKIVSGRLTHMGFAPANHFNVCHKIENNGGYILHYGFIDTAAGRKKFCDNFHIGDTITCVYDPVSLEISFKRNGLSLGVAFSDVKGGEYLAPAFGCWQDGDSLMLSAL